MAQDSAGKSAGKPGEAVGPSFDARVWAHDFCIIAKQLGTPVDEEWMVTWFANALMRGYDEKAAEQRRSLVSLREAAMPLIERLPHGLGPHGIGTDPARCVRCQLQALIAEKLELPADTRKSQ